MTKISLEHWFPISGYEGYYEVNAVGSVRGLDRCIETSRGSRAIKGKILRPKKNTDGYLFYTLSKVGRATHLYAHRLVAHAFIPNFENKPEVNHLDGDKVNNFLYNLEWVTHKENTDHTYRTGLNSNQKASHYLSVGVEDKWLNQTFSTIKEWSEAHNMNYSTARNTLAGYSTSSTINMDFVTTFKPRNV